MLAVLDHTAGRDLGDSTENAHAGRRVDIVPFEPWHLAWLTELTAQAWLGRSQSYAVTLKLGGPAYSAFVGDEVIACAGVIQQWEGRAQAWSILSALLPAYAKTVLKETKTFLAEYRTRRIECTVDPRSTRAKNWARHLGFTYEATMTAYTPGGDDMELWALVRPWLK